MTYGTGGSGSSVGQYYLEVLPSFEGGIRKMSRELDRAFEGVSKGASQALAGGIEDGVRAAESAVKKSLDAIAKLRDKEASAADRLAAAEARIEEVREKGGSALKRAEAQRNAADRARLAALREIESQTKSLERAQERLSDAQRRAADPPGATRAGGWLDRIKDKASAATDALQGLADGAIGGDMSALGGGGEDAGSAFVAGFSSKVMQIGTKAGPVGVALAATAGVALAAGGVVAQQVFEGMEQEQARANVAARLGVDEGTMARIAEAAAEAYAGNFGDSVAGNMDTARAAIEAGLIPAGAGTDVTNQMIAQLETVSDVLGGEDIPNVARAASQAIRTGMAADATAAFDLIVKGQQAGLNVSEDWLDTLNEYSTQFRKLGIDGAEATGLLSQMVKGGARDTDVAADALKEFSIRAVDGSKSTSEAFASLGLDADAMAAKFAQGGPTARAAFDQVTDAVRAVQDPVKRSQIAVGLFGTQAEDLGAALGAMDLSTAVEQLGDVEGAAQRAADMMGGTAASSWESMRRSIEVAVDGVQDELAEAFGPQLEEFATWVSEHEPQITGFLAGLGEAAAAATGSVTAFVTEMTGGLALVVNAVGDTFGAIATVQAEVAELMGDDAKAASFREQAEAGFGLADSLYAVRDGAAAGREAMRDAMENFGQTKEQAALAADNVQRIATLIGQLPSGKKVDLSAVVTYYDENGLVIPPGQLRAPVRAPAVPGDTYKGPGRAEGGIFNGLDELVSFADGAIRGLPSAATIQMPVGPGGLVQWAEPSTGGEAFIPLDGGQRSVDIWEETGRRLGVLASFANGGMLGDAGGLLPFTRQLRALTLETFPQISDIGGYRSPDGYNEHSSGRALDVMIPDWQTPAGIALGNQIAEWALAIPGVNRVMWQQSIIRRGGQAEPVEDRGSPTQNHMDHVHIFTDDVGAGAVPTPPSMPSLTADAAAALGSTSGSTHGFGGGSTYALGAGTPGVDPETGEQGYYVPDAEQIKTAQDKVADADARVAEAEAKQRELEADAKKSQRLAAQNDVDRAKREAADARAELQEAQKGKFTKQEPTSSDSSAGGGELDPIGGIFGSFMKETFGFDGSLFPDIGELGLVKMANAMLGIKYTPQGGGFPWQTGYANGDGTPWSGTPALGGQQILTPAAASSLPFGMIPAAIDQAGVAAAGMAPPGSPASGIGAGPPPGPVDNSKHVAVTVNGIDENRVADNVRRQVLNVDRLHTYAPKGTVTI